MAQSCGCVFSHSKGSWVAGLQEREAHMLMRREVRRAVSTARPSPAHASGPQAPNPGSCRPLLLSCPTWAATLSGGAQGHAFLFFLWADVPGSLP